MWGKMMTFVNSATVVFSTGSVYVFSPALYFLGVMQAQVGMQAGGPVPMERGQGKC